MIEDNNNNNNNNERCDESVGWRVGVVRSLVIIWDGDGG